jgi:hypothetical protein
VGKRNGDNFLSGKAANKFLTHILPFWQPNQSRQQMFFFIKKIIFIGDSFLNIKK